MELLRTPTIVPTDLISGPVQSFQISSLSIIAAFIQPKEQICSKYLHLSDVNPD